VNRSAIARDGRRRQALDALAFERDREDALRAQLHEVVLEEDGRRVDEAAFARMAPGDVTRVREALHAVDGEPLEDDDRVAGQATDDGEGSEDEIRRLQEAIEQCRAAQRALERYLKALETAR
jgi:hypothetical protein